MSVPAEYPGHSSMWQGFHVYQKVLPSSPLGVGSVIFILQIRYKNYFGQVLLKYLLDL